MNTQYILNKSFIYYIIFSNVNWSSFFFFKNNFKKLFSIQKFSFEVKQGDLFRCPAIDSLAHCVSEDFVMGKGIALLFKNKFGSLDELKAQGMKQTIYKMKVL